MRLSLLALLIPSVALAQAPGETPPAAPPSDATAPPAQTEPQPHGEPVPDSELNAPATAPATAPAPSAKPTGPIELSAESVPDPCKPLVKDATAKSINRALSARISLASCLADHKLKPLVLCDCEQSINDVNAATQLSVALLDEVYTRGDASMQILARQAKGDLFSSLVQRLQATVPPPVNGSPDAIALRDTRLDLLQPLLDPWQGQAKSSYMDVDKIAKANPQLAKNPAVVAAVRSSRTKLGTQPTQTATR
ncbi:MAG TPA: hypothetical protein VL326_17930 [Kofleriaceae bacterium]|nr:hypothetical protein [Kofleriaceae bacterium]